MLFRGGRFARIVMRLDPAHSESQPRFVPEAVLRCTRFPRHRRGSMKHPMLVALAWLAGCASPQYPHDPRYPYAPPGAPPPHEQVIRHGERATMSSTQGAWYAATCYAQVFMNRSGGRLAANVARDGPDDHWVVNVTENVPGGAYLAVIRVAPAAAGSNAEMFTTPLAPFGGRERFRRSIAETCR
jgi:hypothetical protein